MNKWMTVIVIVTLILGCGTIMMFELCNMIENVFGVIVPPHLPFILAILLILGMGIYILSKWKKAEEKNSSAAKVVLLIGIVAILFSVLSLCIVFS